MNNSVASFGPKGKTYGKTESLDTRVAIAAGVQILGYELFWKQIFEELGLVFDDNLRKVLRRMQMDKDRKRKLAKTKEGKSKRSRNRTEKMWNVLTLDMQAQKAGIVYETGVALKTA